MPFGDTPAFDRGIDRGVMMPVGELITSAISNKGNPTGFGQDNTFRVRDAEEVRIVDNNGNVIFSGTGPDAARQAVAVGQNLSDTLGKKAGWTIQTGERTINTDGSVGPMRYFDVANEKVNKSVLGKIADIALPVAANFLLPGLGPIGASALGSAASSVAQGRSLEDTLLRAGITAATAGVTKGLGIGAPAPGSDAAISSSVNNAINTAYQNAISGAASEVAKNYGTNLISQIISEATGAVAPTAVSSAIPAPPSAPAPVSIPAPAAYVPPPEEIIATAIRQPDVSSIFPAVTGGVSNALLDQVINQPTQATQPAETQQPTQQEYTPPPEEIVLTAPQNILPPALAVPAVAGAAAAANALGSTTPQSPETTRGMTPEEIQDVTMTGASGGGLLGKLTANMGLTDYLTLASLLGSAVGGSGGGGATTATPYVSPFGAGAGFGTGQDYRVNPNIADYERYAFGPEASFFAPGYSQLVSSAAGAPAATTTGPQGSMLNPQYVPLI